MPEGYISKAKSINWGTPPEILKRFEGYFDPCPYPEPNFDGLNIPWPKWVFVNPPFCELAQWAEKCAHEHEHGTAHIVLLMPARTDTKAFHEYVLKYAEIEFIQRRLKFVDLDNSSIKPVSAPFPCLLAHFGGIRK
jgi:hypothetical protein